MAKVYISEYNDLGGVPGNWLMSGQEPSLVEQTPITSSGTSQQSAAFGSTTRLIRIHTDGIISIAIGPNPTATTNSKRLAANQTEYFSVYPGHRIAIITNT